MQYTFDGSDATDLKIYLDTSDDVYVSASDQSTFVIDIDPSRPDHDLDRAAAERVIVEQVGNRIVVQTPKKLGWSSRFRKGSCSVRVSLPENVNIDVAVGSGNVAVAGAIGTAHIKAGSGNIGIQQTGDATIVAGSGNVTLGIVGGKAKVTTGSGNVTACDARSGGLTVLAGSGNVGVHIAEGVAAHLDVATGLGAVDNQLDFIAEPADDATTFGVSVRTGRGNVVLARA